MIDDELDGVVEEQLGERERAAILEAIGRATAALAELPPPHNLRYLMALKAEGGEGDGKGVISRSIVFSCEERIRKAEDGMNRRRRRSVGGGG